MPRKKLHTIKSAGVSKLQKKKLAKARIQARWKKSDVVSTAESVQEEHPVLDTMPTSQPGPFGDCDDTNVRLRSLEDNVDSVCCEPDNSPSYVIVNLKCLDELLHNISCDMCGNKTLAFHTRDFQGFACRISMKCTTCDGEKSSVLTSNRVVNSESSTRAPFDINRRVVQAFTNIGRGHSAIEQFSAVLNVNSISLSSYNDHLKIITATNTTVAQNSMHAIREEVKTVYREKNITDDNRNEPVDIAVSFDGSWHKRGHTSLYGVGFVIDILTGYVVDYAVISKYCHACQLATKDLGVDSPEFSIWKLGHKSECQQNYSGSSGGMEAFAAELLWKRSTDYGLRYTTLLSDGDSKTFNHLQNLKIYGPIKLVKEECVNHVSKRLGTGLRQVAKEFKLGGKKPGSLTNVTIQKLTRYYGNAIRENTNDVTAMRTAVLATLHHCSSTDANPFHSKCPAGPESWCFYNKAVAMGTQPGTHRQHIHTPISPFVLEKIIPLYQKLASTDLLERCMRGKTQNANECLHSMVWNKCPKENFVSKRKIDIAVAIAVSEFNHGYSKTMTRTLQQAGVSPGHQGMKTSIARDRRRVRNRILRSTQKFQHYRKQVKMAKIRAEGALKQQEGCSYASGGF